VHERHLLPFEASGREAFLLINSSHQRHDASETRARSAGKSIVMHAADAIDVSFVFPFGL